jgi:predicted nucleic acid-binding protein
LRARRILHNWLRAERQRDQFQPIRVHEDARPALLRGSVSDLLIAATAELAGLTVLHVDENFEPVDRLAEPEQVLHDCHAGAPQTASSDNRH